MMDLKTADPKGLIRESYRIDGITAGECRSIFIDWALSFAADTETPTALHMLLELYGAGDPEHPMTVVLRQALEAPDVPKRRGGRAARLGYNIGE